ncbi:hypothetical protein IEO21_04964 [Rhodonia placenta]|uniref:Uncharacterized protein n=1 Tax=Rhodonia placenta TaxID=104341 RepID=A0A8H7U2Q8_9APHY|nr:hypothetical protein IEO21_04964 [Postia placenta]
MDSPDTPSPGTSQQTSGSRPWTITSRPSEDSDRSVTSFRVDACRRWVEANINRSFWSPEFVSGGRSMSIDGGFVRYAFRSATLSTETERSSRRSRRSCRSCPRISSGARGRSGVRGRDVGSSAGAVLLDEPHARRLPAAAPAPRAPSPGLVAALDSTVPVSTQMAPSRRMPSPISTTSATMPPSPQGTSSITFSTTRASPREMHAQTTHSPVLGGRGALALYSSRPSRGMVHRGLHTLRVEDAALSPDTDVLREIQRMLLTGSLGESSHRAFDPHSLDALRYNARTVTSGRSQNESAASNSPHDPNDTLANMVALLHSQSLMDRNIVPEQ